MTLKLALGFQMWKVVVIIGESRIFSRGGSRTSWSGYV